MNPLHVIAGRSQWCVVRGDSRRVLPMLREKSVDHVITDPPYRRALYEGFRTNSRARQTNLSPTGKKLPSAAYTALASMKIGALEDVLPFVAPEFLRLATRWIIAFHDAESGHLWREPFGDAYIRSGIWLKTNPVPQISGDRPAQAYEAMTIAHQAGRKKWNGGGKAGVWRTVWTATALQGNRIERAEAKHPCPKPISLMRELIEDFTDPGDVVLDPFCGSGSTGVACLQLGRRFIGIELDPAYARTAVRRLRAASSRRPDAGRAA